jgi:hypothetical protein
VPNVQYKTPDDGQRRCPKHVEFYNRIKLRLLVRLVVYLKRLPCHWLFSDSFVLYFVVIFIKDGFVCSFVCRCFRLQGGTEVKIVPCHTEK